MELSQAFEMATHFSTELSQDNQIFVTTHSPAFYDLDGNNVGTFRVKSDASHRLHDVTTIGPFADRSAADQFMGLAGLIAKRTREIYEQLDQVKSEADRLSNELSTVTRPRLVLEGPTDVEHFRLAYRKLNDEDCPWAICAGSNADSVVQFCINVTKVAASDFPTIGILDYDGAGKKALNRIKHARRDQEFQNILMLDQEKGIYAGTLLLPEHGKAIVQSAGEDNTHINCLILI